MTKLDAMGREIELGKAFLSESQLLLKQALSRVKHCVEQLDNEQIWFRPRPEMNSIANLILHLNGNLTQWGVNGIQDGPDERDRNREFSTQGGVGRDDLLQKLSDVIDRLVEHLEQLPSNVLLKPRTIQGFHVTVLGALMHTIPHFVGHTHQITQLTRLILGDQYRQHWDPTGARDIVPL